MTLVMSAGVGSSFIAMISDERISYNIGGRLIPREELSMVKAYQITNSVLLGWGGDFDNSLEIKKQLNDVLKPTDTLDVCKQHLETIASELDAKRDFVVVLSGFYKNGKTGKLMMKSDAKVQELKINQLEYRYIMLPPTSDYSDIQDQYLYIDDFRPERIQEELSNLGYEDWIKKSINITLNHLIKVQALISFSEPEMVTSKGYYYITFKDVNGELQSISGDYDTKEMQEKLKSVET